MLFRLIAELSYRGAGRTLTEREYDAEIERFWNLYFHIICLSTSLIFKGLRWQRSWRRWMRTLTRRATCLARPPMMVPLLLRSNKGGWDKQSERQTWQSNKGKKHMLGKAADDGPLVTAIKQRWVRHGLLSNKVRDWLGNQTKVRNTCLTRLLTMVPLLWQSNKGDRWNGYIHFHVLSIFGIVQMVKVLVSDIRTIRRGGWTVYSILSFRWADF